MKFRLPSRFKIRQFLQNPGGPDWWSFRSSAESSRSGSEFEGADIPDLGPRTGGMIGHNQRQPNSRQTLRSRSLTDFLKVLGAINGHLLCSGFAYGGRPRAS